MKNITALYCRLAHADDTRTKQQEADLRQFAEVQGYSTVVSYVDNGASDLTMNRPALSELDGDIKAGKIQTVIVCDISRIGRDYTKTHKWIDSLDDSSVEFVIVNHPKESDFAAEVQRLLGAFHKGEVQNIGGGFKIKEAP